MHTPGAPPFLLVSPTPLSPLGPCPPSLHPLPKHRADRHFRPLQSEHKHKYFAPPLSRRSFHHPEPNPAHTHDKSFISLSLHTIHPTRPLLPLHYHTTTTTRRRLLLVPSNHLANHSANSTKQPTHQTSNGCHPLQRHHGSPEPSSMPRPTTNLPSASHPHKEELSIVNHFRSHVLSWTSRLALVPRPAPHHGVHPRPPTWPNTTTWLPFNPPTAAWHATPTPGTN